MSDLTPAQRIEAAIVRLEELRDASTPTDWRVVAVDDRADIRADKGYDYRGSAIATAADSSFGATSMADADLICTLHATIDAQLAILHDTLNLFRDPIPMFAGREEQICAAQLGLADAIISGGTE